MNYVGETCEVFNVLMHEYLFGEIQQAGVTTPVILHDS